MRLGVWLAWLETGDGGVQITFVIRPEYPEGYYSIGLDLNERSNAGMALTHEAFEPYYPSLVIPGVEIGHLQYGRYGVSRSSEIVQLVSPLWFLLLLFAPLPLVRFWLWRRRRAARTAGNCPTCGTVAAASPSA